MTGASPGEGSAPPPPPVPAATPPQGRMLQAIGALALADLAAHALFLVWLGRAGAQLYLLTGLAALLLVPLGVVCLAAALAGRSPAPRQKARRAAMVVLLVAWTAAYVTARPQDWLIDLGARWRVRALCGEDRLQAWAAKALRDTAGTPLQQQDFRTSLHQEDPPDAPDEALYLTAAQLPPDIRALGVYQDAGVQGVAIRLEPGAGRVVEVAIGSDWLHAWGVVAGPPSLELHSTPQRWVHRWRPGLYGVQGVGPGFD